jgi:hypothetical protein
MHAKSIAFLLLGIVLAGMTSGACGQAWSGSCYGPGWFGCGFPTVYETESVPYFALHPPVYYSYRVARTYGRSPFAYPPEMAAAGSAPRWDDRRSDRETDEPAEPRPPLRIVNPYVQGADRGDVTESPKRRPQVIYPASLVKRS